MMEDIVKVILDNNEYELNYNSETEYYELELIAPDKTGLHNINVRFTSDKETTTSNVDLIVLKKEKISIKSELVAYFLDNLTFEILDVIQLNIEEINRDLETNGSSSFASSRRLNIQENDFIFLKKSDKFNFLGIVMSQSQNEENQYIISCKDILSLFDIDVFVENADIIQNIGIEDFLKKIIDTEFINNSDNFVNRKFLSVEAMTHNTKNIQIDSIVTVTNGIYNLLTFIDNAIEKYDLQFQFILEKNTLKLQIFTKEESKLLIDTTTSDITNYSEVFSLSYTAKVEVKNKENENIYYRYLLNDRTTTTDKDNPNRIFGKTKKIFVEKESDSEQCAIDIFKSNSYNHNITFDINKNTKLYDINKFTIGTSICIKTKNKMVYETYISKIKDNNSNFLTITCGNLRVNYIDKFLQERRK